MNKPALTDMTTANPSEPSSKAPLVTISSPDQLAVGDIVYRRKGIVTHVGVCLGQDEILHNTPKYGEHQTDFATFANGKTVYSQPSGVPAEKVIDKAQQILQQPASYGLFNRNCEHTASSVLNDEGPISQQLNEIANWAFIGGAYGKSIGKKSMYIGGFLGALGGLLSLPRMWWIK